MDWVNDLILNAPPWVIFLLFALDSFHGKIRSNQLLLYPQQRPSTLLLSLPLKNSCEFVIFFELKLSFPNIPNILFYDNQSCIALATHCPTLPFFM